MSTTPKTATANAMATNRATKKVRFRENDDFDDSDARMQANESATTITNPNTHMSFKDIAMRFREDEGTSIKDLAGFKDIILSDEDQIASTEAGIPSIRFSDRIMSLVDQDMDNTVIVKLLGRKINLTVLQNKLQSIWGANCGFHVMDLDNEYHLVKFSKTEDYSRVLADGPWVVFGQYLTVQSWTPGFDTDIPYPRNLTTWIRLPGLPPEFYRKSFLQSIAGLIGKVVKIDQQTEAGLRGRFARVAVAINLDEPLISKVIVQGRLQRVEYESLPTICFNCGRYGHHKEACTGPNGVNNGGNIPPDLENRETTKNQPTKVKIRVENEAFGSWMVVDRRRNKPTGKGGERNSERRQVEARGSRFSVLSEESDAPRTNQTTGGGQTTALTIPTDNPHNCLGPDGPKSNNVPFLFGQGSGEKVQQQKITPRKPIARGKEIVQNKESPSCAIPANPKSDMNKYSLLLSATHSIPVQTSLPQSSNSVVRMVGSSSRNSNSGSESAILENGGFKLSGKPKVKLRYKEKKCLPVEATSANKAKGEKDINIKEAIELVIQNTVQVAEAENNSGEDNFVDYPMDLNHSVASELASSEQQPSVIVQDNGKDAMVIGDILPF